MGSPATLCLTSTMAASAHFQTGPAAQETSAVSSPRSRRAAGGWPRLLPLALFLGLTFPAAGQGPATPPLPPADPVTADAAKVVLPASVPERASISGTELDKRIAREDYALVLRELGPCSRNRPHH